MIDDSKKHLINLFYVDKLLIPFSENELVFEEKFERESHLY